MGKSIEAGVRDSLMIFEELLGITEGVSQIAIFSAVEDGGKIGFMDSAAANTAEVDPFGAISNVGNLYVGTNALYRSTGGTILIHLQSGDHTSESWEMQFDGSSPIFLSTGHTNGVTLLQRTYGGVLSGYTDTVWKALFAYDIGDGDDFEITIVGA